MRIYFETEPVRIGKHEWRMVVTDSDVLQGFRSTEYQFRRSPSDAWQPGAKWPTYNSHDGTYAGCPKSLCDKVFRPNKPQILVALITVSEVGRHDWGVGAKCEDGYPVFVDDRQLSYRPTPLAAKAYALEIIARLRADGDYRLNDRPQGFLPPELPPADLLKADPIKDLLLACLATLGWEKDLYLDVFSKAFKTAVGPRAASLWLRFDKESNQWLFRDGDFTSAGENVLAAHFADFPVDMPEEDVKKTVAAYVAAAERKIASAYSVRLLNNAS